MTEHLRNSLYVLCTMERCGVHWCLAVTTGVTEGAGVHSLTADPSLRHHESAKLITALVFSESVLVI